MRARSSSELPPSRPLVLAAALGVAACAVQQHPLTATAASGLRGRRIATTARPPTPFFVSKPAKNQVNTFGIVGGVAIAAAMSDAGGRIVRENGIADPAPSMAQRLSDDFRRQYGVKLDQQSVYVTEDDPMQIASLHPESDLLLDVWIKSVSVEPFSHDPSRYQVKYVAYLRLIDTRIVHVIDGQKGQVIAHGTCAPVPEETPSAPTYDELLANGAQRLKRELDLAAQACVDLFRSKVLAAGPTP